MDLKNHDYIQIIFLFFLHTGVDVGMDTLVNSVRGKSTSVCRRHVKMAPPVSMTSAVTPAHARPPIVAPTVKQVRLAS